MIEVGTTTTAAQLQALINSAEAGTTIALDPGTFHFDRTIVVNRDNVTIMGAGSDQTKIMLSGDAVSNGAFQIGSVIDQPVFSGKFALGASALMGDATLEFRDAGDLHAGDYLWIERPNTQDYLDSIGAEEWLGDKPLRTSMVQIASVDGNSVTLRNGLAFNFSASDAEVSRVEVAENVKLGGFSIDSGLPTSDPSRFENVSSAYDRDEVVSVSAASDVKVFDIHIREAPSNGFTFAQSTFVEGANLTVDGARNKGDGGNGYAYQLRSLYDSTMNGLEAYNTRHGVVFASWTSEANNSIGVQYTNRDINFHGSPDHGNSVSVDNSIRTDVEATYLSPSLFTNSEGTTYGAPTNPAANTVLFGTVYGTNKAETLTALPSGSEFHARSSADTLIGGDHSDKLYGDNGNDVIYGSAGIDIIDGGAGGDRLRYAGQSSDYVITTDSAHRILVEKPDGHDIVTSVETIAFDDRSIATSTITATSSLAPATSTQTATADSGFDRVVSSGDYQLVRGDEALNLDGGRAIDGKGNGMANALRGNDAANTLWGVGGDDRIYARGGDDKVYGGQGNDVIYGQAGNDHLSGGDGNDLLIGNSGKDILSGGDGLDSLFGGAGADRFVFSTGRDVVQDFSSREGDRIDIGSTHLSSVADFAERFAEAAKNSGNTLAELGVDVFHSGTGSHSHVVISAIGDDGKTVSMDLHGTTLNELLPGDYWLI